MQHQVVPIVLAGVRSPSPSKKATGDEVPESTGQAEEFGDEARWFVEGKLLQRNVKVEIMCFPLFLMLTTADLISLRPCSWLRSNILPVISHNF